MKFPSSMPPETKPAFQSMKIITFFPTGNWLLLDLNPDPDALDLTEFGCIPDSKSNPYQYGYSTDLIVR